MSPAAADIVVPPALRERVKTLMRPNPAIYWTDFLLSVAGAWAGFGLLFFSPTGSLAGVAGFALAVLLFYRSLLFAHEIVHLRRGTLTGFEATWNLLCGYFMFLPTMLYRGVHNDHHNVATYGTVRDPEYVPLAGQRLRIVASVARDLVLPLLLFTRFALLSPLGWVSPRFRRVLHERYSALSFNPDYRRRLGPGDSGRLVRQEVATFFAWWGMIAAAAHFGTLAKALGCFLAIQTTMSLANIIRTLASHKYGNHPRATVDRDTQLMDSIDLPGGWLTELWAPVGMRFHALHHFLPGIPYHNLATLHRELLLHLPRDSRYRASQESGLRRALASLWSAPAVAGRA